MCKLFKVNRSGFYRWLEGVPSKRALDNLKLLSEINMIYHQSKRTYGSPRIARVLCQHNILVSGQKVARLMKKENIRSVIKKKFKATTDSEHKYAIAENRLERNFKPGTTGIVWVSDITYIKTRQGWLYLTIVIDLGDSKSHRLGTKFYDEGTGNSHPGIQNGTKKQAYYTGTVLSF